MKFYTLINRNQTQELAVSNNDGQTLYPLTQFQLSFNDMNDLIANISTEQLTYLQQELQNSNKYSSLPIEQVTLAAPIPHPKQDIICLGINYLAHAEESARYKQEAFGGERPYAVYFSKRVNEAVGHLGNIPAYENLVDSLDYEVELAVIIGKTAKNVSKEEAYDYVFGYTILNDVSARNLQTRHKQWYFGKSLDGFTPMGPCIVTADEIKTPPTLAIKSYVNGELRQDSNTDLLIFDIAHVISELSQGMTLLPGTIIAMGTPAGVGMGFQPPQFLKTGDTVTCEIEKIGKLTNYVK